MALESFFNVPTSSANARQRIYRSAAADFAHRLPPVAGFGVPTPHRPYTRLENTPVYQRFRRAGMAPVEHPHLKTGHNRQSMRKNRPAAPVDALWKRGRKLEDNEFHASELPNPLQLHVSGLGRSCAEEESPPLTSIQLTAELSRGAGD